MAFRVLPDANLAQVVTDADMTFNIVSEPFNLHNCASCILHLGWIGNPTGPFAVQISTDHQQDLEGNVQNEGEWDELPISKNIEAFGVAGTANIEILKTSAPYIRIIYAAVSGSGVLNTFIAAKGNA